MDPFIRTSDPEQMLRWFDELEGESVPDDQLDDEILSDADSRHSDHNTDTEQSSDETDEVEDPMVRSRCYVGKDNVTLWRVSNRKKITRTSQRNIVTRLPGVKGQARLAENILDCWKLYFPDSFISKIVEYTNIYIEQIQANYSRERDCRKTDYNELCALFGLLYLAGIKKAHRLNMKELWESDGTAPDCFRATMSIRRFYFLLRALRFDDIRTREERKSIDNLAPIREIFEQFVQNCQAHYTPGEYLTIDEMLDAFRGRCKFRQYIKSKPARYGIKIFAMCDARVFYTSNLEIYAGKQPDGPYKVDNSAASVVKRLSTPISGTGRNITVDNYFTSVPLATELLQEHKLTLVGTLRKDKREIPPIFKEVNIRPTPSSMFAFGENCLLVSFVPPKKKQTKNVLLISTMHNDDAVDEETQKPEVVMFYNLTKGGVDVVDELKSLYSVARVSCRWPLTIFFSLMNIGGINSYVIYKTNTQQTRHDIQRRIFLKQLGIDLVMPHIMTRLSVPNLPPDLRTVLQRFAKIPTTTTNSSELVLQQGICHLCPRRKNRKTKKVCYKCKKHICNEHTEFNCTNCSRDAQNQGNLSDESL